MGSLSDSDYFNQYKETRFSKQQWPFIQSPPYTITLSRRRKVTRTVLCSSLFRNYPEMFGELFRLLPKFCMNDFACRGDFIEVVRPILHHLLTFVEKAGAVIGGIDLIAGSVG